MFEPRSPDTVFEARPKFKEGRVVKLLGQTTYSICTSTENLEGRFHAVCVFFSGATDTHC